EDRHDDGDRDGLHPLPVPRFRQTVRAVDLSEYAVDVVAHLRLPFRAAATSLRMPATSCWTFASSRSTRSTSASVMRLSATASPIVLMTSVVSLANAPSFAATWVWFSGRLSRATRS